MKKIFFVVVTGVAIATLGTFKDSGMKEASASQVTATKATTEPNPYLLGNRKLFSQFAIKNDVIYFALDDQVLDDCLPDVSSIKNAWMEQLQSHGFKLTEDLEDGDFFFFLKITGFATSPDSCVAHIASKFKSPYGEFHIDDSKESTKVWVTIWQDKNMLSSNRDTFEEKIIGKSKVHVDDFFITYRMNSRHLDVE